MSLDETQHPICFSSFRNCCSYKTHLSQKTVRVAVPCGVICSFWRFLHSSSYSLNFGKRRYMNLSKFFLVRSVIPLLSPLICVQGWQRTLKLLSICSCRGEGENTRGCGHSSELHSHPKVVPQSTAEGVCLPWTAWEHWVVPSAQCWGPLTWETPSSTSQSSGSVNTGGHCILQGVCLPQQHTKI